MHCICVTLLSLLLDRCHCPLLSGEWQFATSKDCSSVEEVEQFMEEALRGSCEGLMVKALGGARAQYDIARRSHNWLKVYRLRARPARVRVVSARPPDVADIGLYYLRSVASLIFTVCISSID